MKIHSCQIGKTARRLLTPGACGHVLAGFSKAAYLATEQSELFWLIPENAPMHPRGLHISGPFPNLAGGESFFIEGEYIRIAPDLSIAFRDAPPWAMSDIPTEAALEIAQIPLEVEKVFQTKFDLSEASGFGRMIPKILSLAASQQKEEAEIDPVLALAWPGINKIANACLMRNMTGLFQESDTLVGLGEGLTPSGDDFLGGLLFCLNTIGRLYPGLICLDLYDQALFLDSAKDRTHPISFTLLKDLTNGQAVEPLHELIHSILSDQPLESIRPVSCLTQIGHSTGWDLLTGALTGLLLTFRSHDSTDSSAVSPTQDIYA